MIDIEGDCVCTKVSGVAIVSAVEVTIIEYSTLEILGRWSTEL
jgi:hypothetical protein